MPGAIDIASLHRSSPIFAASAAERTWLLPGWRNLEDGMARALDAIRHYARIAWWDGSSVGLHLHGYVGLFGFVEPDTLGQRCEERP